MSYVKDTLQNGEEILVVPELHWINYCLPFLTIIGALILVGADFYFNFTDHGLLLIAAFMIIYAGYRVLYLKFKEMAVTNKRVVLRKGIVASDGDEMKNIALTGIEVEQTVMGRILNYGNICFTSAGSGRLMRVVFADVKGPRALKARIEDAIEGKSEMNAD